MRLTRKSMVYSREERHMTRKLWFLAVLFVALLTLGATMASAQAVDARKALEAAAKAMGTTNLKSIQYVGDGFVAKVGEQYNLTDGWPQVQVTDWTRTVDYDGKYTRVDYDEKQGGAHVTKVLNGNFAWDMNGDTPVPLTRMYLDGVPYVDMRQLEIALTPHGCIKAGLAATDATAITQPIVGPSDFGLSAFGQWVTIVSFSYGKYRVNCTITDKNLVELTGTWVRNPVYGDMTYEMRYTQYKDYNGVMFPGLIHVHQGDPRINPGENYFQVYVKD